MLGRREADIPTLHRCTEDTSTMWSGCGRADLDHKSTSDHMVLLGYNGADGADSSVLLSECNTVLLVKLLRAVTDI